MTFFNKLAMAAAVAVGLAPLTAPADTLADIKARGKVQIAVDLGAPPWGTVDADLKPAGADVDVAKLLAQDLGVELELVEVTGPNRVPYLLTNRTDIVVSSFAITEERAKVVDFVPYSVNRLIVFAGKDVEITDVASLAGKNIGVVRGNLQDTELTKIAPEGTILTRYDDDATTIQALASGQVEAMCAPYGMFLNLQEKFPDRNFEAKLDVVQQPLGIGLRQNEPEMKKWLIDWVETRLADGSLNKIFETYMGGSLPDLSGPLDAARATLK